MQENWVGWEPLDGVPYSLYIDRIIYNVDGLRCELSNEDQNIKIEVLFDNFIFSYRITDEGIRIETTTKIIKTYGIEFLKKWRFFTVENSLYLEWIHKETSNMYTKVGLRHFVVITNDDFIDVICNKAPRVRYI